MPKQKTRFPQTSNHSPADCRLASMNNKHYLFLRPTSTRNCNLFMALASMTHANFLHESKRVENKLPSNAVYSRQQHTSNNLAVVLGNGALLLVENHSQHSWELTFRKNHIKIDNNIHHQPASSCFSSPCSALLEWRNSAIQSFLLDHFLEISATPRLVRVPLCSPHHAMVDPPGHAHMRARKTVPLCQQGAPAFQGRSPAVQMGGQGPR